MLYIFSVFHLSLYTQSIAHVVASKSFMHRLPVNVLIRRTDSQPIVAMTAKEFMLGYKSELIHLGNTLLPHWIYFDKVGLIDRVSSDCDSTKFRKSNNSLLHQMYDFSGDFSTFYTGETDISLSGLYDTFRGSPNLPQWDGEHCSNIRNASDGTKFKSFIKPDEELLFFRKSMCRPQRLVSYVCCVYVERTFEPVQSRESKRKRNYAPFRNFERAREKFVTFCLALLEEIKLKLPAIERSEPTDGHEEIVCELQPVRQD